MNGWFRARRSFLHDLTTDLPNTPQTQTEGPQAMLRGAVLYGGLMYLLSGNVLGGSRRRPFEYEEQTVEF